LLPFLEASIVAVDGLTAAAPLQLYLCLKKKLSTTRNALMLSLCPLLVSVSFVDLSLFVEKVFHFFGIHNQKNFLWV